MTIGPFAPFYRWVEYAAFGRALERMRFAFLNRLAGARSILVLGEGDGRALAQIVNAAPQATIEVIELSPSMIQLALERTGAATHVTFCEEDARTAPLQPHAFDAIVTLFFLDCFSESDLQPLTRRISGALRPGGCWLIADFDMPSGFWRRLHARLWIATMYRFFGVVTGLRTRRLPAIFSLPEQLGLRRVASCDLRLGLIRSEVFSK